MDTSQRFGGTQCRVCFEPIRPCQTCDGWRRLGSDVTCPDCTDGSQLSDHGDRCSVRMQAGRPIPSRLEAGKEIVHKKDFRTDRPDFRIGRKGGKFARHRSVGSGPAA